MAKEKKRQSLAGSGEVPSQRKRRRRRRRTVQQRSLPDQSEGDSFSAGQRREEEGPREEGQRSSCESESPFNYSWDTESQGGSESGKESQVEAEIPQMMMDSLEEFYEFCNKQEFSNKSLSQLAVLWVLVVFRAPGGFGKFAEVTLENAVSSQGTGEPWRDVLPLPVPDGVAKTVSHVLQDGGFSFKKTGMTGNQVQSEYRRVGVDCLVFVMITAWGGLRKGSRVHSGPWRTHHHVALGHLTESAAYVIDGKDTGGKGVPRTPLHDWSKKVSDARISYHGEILMKAEELEFDRVLPSLPPEGFGGVVPILDVVEGRVKELLSDPSRCVLPEKELPQVIPRPRVRVKQGDWEKLCIRLFTSVASWYQPRKWSASERSQFEMGSLVLKRRARTSLMGGRLNVWSWIFVGPTPSCESLKETSRPWLVHQLLLLSCWRTTRWSASAEMTWWAAFIFSSCRLHGTRTWLLNEEYAGGAWELTVRAQPIWHRQFFLWAFVPVLASCNTFIGGWPCGNLLKVEGCLMSWSSGKTEHGQIWARLARYGPCTWMTPLSFERWKRMWLWACKESLRKNRSACDLLTSFGASPSMPRKLSRRPPPQRGLVLFLMVIVAVLEWRSKGCWTTWVWDFGFFSRAESAGKHFRSSWERKSTPSNFGDLCSLSMTMCGNLSQVKVIGRSWMKRLSVKWSPRWAFSHWGSQIGGHRWILL